MFGGLDGLSVSGFVWLGKVIGLLFLVDEIVDVVDVIVNVYFDVCIDVNGCGE